MMEMVLEIEERVAGLQHYERHKAEVEGEVEIARPLESPNLDP